MKKISKHVKRIALIGAFFVFMGILTFGSLPKVQAFSDNVHWTQCEGRFTVGTGYFKGSYVRAYGCRNGYFFTHTSSSRKGQVLAYITREKPYYVSLSSLVNGYSATTNMVSMRSGGTYFVWGYTPEGSYSFRFTW